MYRVKYMFGLNFVFLIKQLGVSIDLLCESSASTSKDHLLRSRNALVNERLIAKQNKSIVASIIIVLFI